MSPTHVIDPSRPAEFLGSDQTRLIHKHDEFKERMEYLYQYVVGSYKMAGVDRIYMPGKLEQLIQEERVRSVFLYVEAVIEALNEEAKRVGSYEIMVTDWEEQTESKN
jgi:LDH2 family malate/lactate/ureidoglycolate dehydrogenase